MSTVLHRSQNRLATLLTLKIQWLILFALIFVVSLFHGDLKAEHSLLSQEQMPQSEETESSSDGSPIKRDIQRTFVLMERRMRNIHRTTDFQELVRLLQDFREDAITNREREPANMDEKMLIRYRLGMDELIQGIDVAILACQAGNRKAFLLGFEQMKQTRETYHDKFSIKE